VLKSLKPKKSRKVSHKSLVKKIDHLHSLFIRNRDKKCVQCGSINNLGVGHIFSRRNLSTRWDISDDGNCHTQCWPCNFKHVRDQYPYFNWYIKKFGDDKFQALRLKHDQIVKISTSELNDLLVKFS